MKSSDHAARLRSRNVRATGPRQAVLARLDREAFPLSAKEVWSKLPSPKSDLVSIYRILTRFVEEGIVARVEFGDGTTRYELKRSHHHHARCSACGRVEDIALCVKDMAKKVHRKSGFQILYHELQMTGLCKSCARRVKSPSHQLSDAAVAQ